VPAEKDPYYLRGMRLEQEGKHEKATAAFERCLRRNPECAKAHLQLGILYEDMLNDAVSAMYHYDRYLQQVTQGDDADMVRRWRQRTETAYYERLRETLAPATVAEDPKPALDSPTESDQERQLVESVRQLQTEIQQLRQQLAQPASTADARPVAVAAKPTSPPPEQPETPPSGERYYTVKSGDTLSEVSRQVYGTSKHWALLRDANRDVLNGSDRLKPGMQIRIPSLKSSTEPKG